MYIFNQRFLQEKVRDYYSCFCCSSSFKTVEIDKIIKNFKF